MKEYASTLAMVGGMALILIAIVMLSTISKMPETSPVLLGLTAAVSSMAGAIGGYSMHREPRPPSSITNSPGAQVTEGTSSTSIEEKK